MIHACIPSSLGALALAFVSGAALGAPTQFPLKRENCGAEITLDHAPRRAVGLGQNSTEILLLLGLADRMTERAIWVSPVLPEVARENEKVRRISKDTPGFEAVVAVEPDFLAVQFLTAIGPRAVSGRVGSSRISVFQATFHPPIARPGTTPRPTARASRSLAWTSPIGRSTSFPGSSTSPSGDRR